MADVLRTTQVWYDRITGDYRVICPIHGELARYTRASVADRDARQHDGVCGSEET